MLKDFTDEYARYRKIAEKAIEQVADDQLNRVTGPDHNSIATLVKHIGGNLRSRFTDFLTADGEKAWRNRDAEFEGDDYSREDVTRMWAEGWSVLEAELVKLTDQDLQREVRIRGQAWTVHAALSRSLAHVAYHVGQIVLLARMVNGEGWRWISIPKGHSQDYNLNPTKEKRPE